ncbi:MAG: amino acid ABC transporter substrate-binding protein [Desulfobacteraceae bacterium]|nr:amino acid ABC transporter substrate-binding protein [Desulfobacteraceae bacterium]
MKTLFLLCVLLYLFFLSAAHANEPYVTVRLSDYKPHYFKNKNGQWMGIEYDMVKEIIQKAGYKMMPVLTNWSRGLADLKAGKLDILLCMVKTPERKKFIHFLGISTHEQTVLLTKEHNQQIQINCLDDFTKMNHFFGIRQNFFYSREFNSRYEIDRYFSSHFISVATAELVPRMLKADRIIGALGNKTSLFHNLLSDPEYSEFIIKELSFFKPVPVYFGASKKADPQKLEKLQKAYNSLKDSGRLDAILKSWIGEHAVWKLQLSNTKG